MLLNKIEESKIYKVGLEHFTENHKGEDAPGHIL